MCGKKWKTCRCQRYNRAEPREADPRNRVFARGKRSRRRVVAPSPDDLPFAWGNKDIEPPSSIAFSSPESRSNSGNSSPQPTTKPIFRPPIIRYALPSEPRAAATPFVWSISNPMVRSDPHHTLVFAGQGVPLRNYPALKSLAKLRDHSGGSRLARKRVNLSSNGLGHGLRPKNSEVQGRKGQLKSPEQTWTLDISLAFSDFE